MTDTLPIIFARGQNESIDPRVAPPNAHLVAQNVRWRKDGRPAKRYGLSVIPTTGLDGGGRTYTANAVNAIGLCNGTPTMVLGGGVRQLINGAWTNVGFAQTSEISHWGPGKHDPIARSDASQLQGASVGYSTGVLLYAWDDGTSIYYSVRAADGSIISPPQALTSGKSVRVISTTNFLYLLYAPVGSATLVCTTFDPVTLTFGTVTLAGTLNVAGASYDAVGRGADFVVVYQSAAAVLTTVKLSATASPVASAPLTTAMAAAQQAKVTIASSATSAVFIAWTEATSGRVAYATFDHAVSGVTSGPTNVDTNTFNVDQPGLIVDTNTTGGILWGGLTASPANSYVKTADLDSSGTVTTGFTLPFVRLASKPFANGTSNRYFWAHSHNSDATNSGKAWDDQRTFYLLRTKRGGTSAQTSRQMHTPGMVGSTGSYTSHLAEAVDTGSGFFTALVNTIRFGNGAAENYGIDSVSFHSIFENQRYAALDVAQAGRALQISGGALYEFNGSPEETGFSNFPVVLSALSSAGGGLTPSSNYLYRVVFEWIDSQGRRHRSAPSDPIAFATTGANFTALVITQTLLSSSRQGTPVAHFYRTLAGGTTYHRVTPNVGAPSTATGTVSFTDSMSDANAATQEFLYTDGGVLPNALPPPCTFMTVCNGRLWVGGQLDRNVLTASKLLVDGEPTQFTNSDAFSAFLPEECTGLASIDGTVIAFAREAIYLINGEGPNDQGNGSFNPPQKLPAEVGCIDWRSVVETSLGVFFQAKRGIFLLPRGFNTPLFIGAEIESTLSGFPTIVSATVVALQSPGQDSLAETTVRFVAVSYSGVISSVVLVYDLRTQGWSVDFTTLSSSAIGLCGTWNDSFIVTGANTTTGVFNGIWREDVTTFADGGLGGPDGGGTFVPTTLGTGDIRPFGVAGYGGFDSVVLVGEYRGDSNVTISVSVDGAAADNLVFPVTSADAPDGSVYLDVTPKTRMGAAIRVTAADSAIGGTASEGFIPQALFIEHETIGKTKRLAQARRA